MAKKKAAKSEPLFVKSKVREYIKGKGCNTSGSVLDGDTLNGIIMDMLNKAVGRAKANNRKTVKARDL
jgi:histone H3/H4